MNEMYNMSIVTHYYSVLGVFVVIFVNFLMLRRAVDIAAYQRQMTLFNPIGSIALASVIFTGIVMMAAKHLAFSIENILMILFSLAMIYLEVKRTKTLKYINKKDENSLENYKKYTSNIFLIEFVLILSISLWMLR